MSGIRELSGLEMSGRIVRFQVLCPKKIVRMDWAMFMRMSGGEIFWGNMSDKTS